MSHLWYYYAEHLQIHDMKNNAVISFFAERTADAKALYAVMVLIAELALFSSVVLGIGYCAHVVMATVIHSMHL